MDWVDENLTRVLDWLEQANNSRYVNERHLDPFATSMRDFDDVTQDLQYIRDRLDLERTDVTQRISDLKNARLVENATTLSTLGQNTLLGWEQYGVANAEIDDELARHLILLREAYELKVPNYLSFVNYWGELRQRFNHFDLIDNWDALYVLNYLDYQINDYCPGARYNQRVSPIKEIKFDLVNIAKGVDERDQAVAGANRINRAISSKIPRGRHRATFCSALEIIVSRGTSMETILGRFGIPKKPRQWRNFDEPHMQIIRQIVKNYSSMEYKDEELPPQIIKTDIDNVNDNQETMDDNQELSLPRNIDFGNVLVYPPEEKDHSSPVIQESTTKRTKVDYVAKASVSKQIGDLGEEFAIHFERWRLREYPELAERIKHVSKEDDSAGYDISSFEENGSPRFVEVKSTTGELNTPFYISAYELKVARENMDKYLILRVFDLKYSPKCCEIRFPFEGIINLEPLTYFATFH